VDSELGLAAAVASAKLRACEHCHRVGMLVGHGRLLGYAESCSERVVRGHRLLCSARHNRRGCGRTVTVWLSSSLRRRIVRTSTVLSFLTALAAGSRVAAGWRAASSMSLRTGYRIRSCVAHAVPAIRTALLSRAPPPRVDGVCADGQLLQHAVAVFGTCSDAFAAYQCAFQRPLLG
jgi:hypothetical protein